MLATTLLKDNFMFGAISKKDLKVINDYFEQFVKLSQYRINRFTYIEKTGNKNIDEMFENWNKQIKQSDDLIKDDVRVIGEAVLASDKIEQGIFDVKINSITKNPMIRTLAANMNKMVISLNTNMGELENTLAAYASHDYRSQININQRLKANMLSLMTSVNSLGQTLNDSAKIDLNSGETLLSNSSVMNSSMTNLTNSANQQASSLEETAAALEEITSLTRNNAQNSSKMAQLGQTVQASVKDGSELAGKTASSMDEINEKVTAIKDSINVIDQIAFQTNILSLNAAVEAATAGEAGKGFAVVAQEVRNLASRSAEAAREIKDLVDDANDKANQGKNISNDMRNGYQNLNKHIGETIDLISDVSQSSKEQLRGIEQINDSITSLDSRTQENASESSKVATLSVELSTMANTIVADASKKQFN